MALTWKIALVAFLVGVIGPVHGAVAQARHQAQVTVSIRVDPIAEISFPQGTSFAIRVPPLACLPPFSFHQRACPQWWQHWWPPIAPVRIPFVVKGNALATVSALPSSYVRISSGRYLGEAENSGEQLGFHVIVQFPVPNNSYHWVLGWTEWSDWGRWNNWAGFGGLPIWSQIAQLPGLDGIGTPPITTNMVDRGGTAYGMIYIVAAHRWTVDGHSANPGPYHGSIQVTMAAGQ